MRVSLKHSALAIAVGAALGIGTAQAAPPANDDFANAIDLVVDNGTSSGNSVADATNEANEPDNHGYVVQTVWFKWTCTTSGLYTFSTDGTLTDTSAPWDAAVDVFDGGPAITGLNLLKFSDAAQAETLQQLVTAGTTYYIRVGYGGGNGPATDVNGLVVTWSFVIPPPPVAVDISNDLNGAPAGASFDIDAAVGLGNTGRLVGTTETGWWTAGISVPVALNGNRLNIYFGGNENKHISGPISGTGEVAFNASGGGPGTIIDGSVGNTYSGPTTASNYLTLAKTAGDALCSGPITLNSGGSKVMWSANDQINDLSDVELTASGASLVLNGKSDTIKDLSLVTGSYVQTGAGGILKVARLFINGTQVLPEVAKIAGDGYVLGSGWIEVGASGPPVVEDPPAIPTTPVPTDGFATVHPANLPMLDWADCALATSYEVYLWIPPATRPETPTATVSLSEWPVSPQVDSLTTYKWQVIARNGVGPTEGPEWSFTTIDRRDISNAIGPITDGGMNIDAVVGVGNSARLVGTVETGWWTAGFSVPVDLNGNRLNIYFGGNENKHISGPISGNGEVAFNHSGGGPGTIIDGIVGNTYTGPTTASNYLTLAKTAGDALCDGPITLDTGNSKVMWSFNDQINDASDVALTASGALLVLNGHTDTIASLTLATGASVDTGSGGVLTVSALNLPGDTKLPGTYTSVTDPTFITGTGSVVVSGAVSNPYDTWALANAGSQSASEDFNNDGVSNGVAYFMGMDGLATNPGVVAGKVTWDHVNTVAFFEVQVSDNLTTWAPADPGDVDVTTDPTKVVYTLPTGAAKTFCRLVVTP